MVERDIKPQEKDDVTEQLFKLKEGLAITTQRRALEFSKGGS